jgi:hypothetical protein
VHQYQWDEIAWNGLSFLKPCAWDIATLGRNYLMIGTPAYPRMEITWGPVQKRVLKQMDIRKLHSQIRKHHLAPVDAWIPSTDWLQALPSFEASGFSWKRPEKKSYGLILSCLSCQRVSLIQFFQNAGDKDDIHSVASKVLSSFTDHAAGDNQKWAIFDIRAALPAVFQIRAYQFSSGFMEMVFFSSGQQLSLYRWSPASVLLSGKTLPDFAESLSLYPKNASVKILDSTRIEWEHSPGSGIWSRFAALLPGGFSHHRIGIRHDKGNNRILAIKADSSQRLDSSLFDQIFSSYEIQSA